MLILTLRVCGAALPLPGPHREEADRRCGRVVQAACVLLCCGGGVLRLAFFQIANLFDSPVTGDVTEDRRPNSPKARGALV